jgi:hypothetical protein
VVRDTAIKRTGSLLNELEQQRDNKINQYDAPPDAEDEAFW